MWVEILRVGLMFSRSQIDLRFNIPRFTLKINVMPSIFLGNPINVC